MMKKFTEKNKFIIRIIVAVFSGVMWQLSFQLSESVPVQLVLLGFSIAVYAIPLFKTVYRIRNYRIGRIRKFILRDLCFTLAPAVVAATFTELVFSSFSNYENLLSGMGSVIFICISLLLTAAFWLAYLLINIMFTE